MHISGLTIGGKLRRNHVAKLWSIHMLGWHNWPKRSTWRWFIEAYRYRAESQCLHGFLRVDHLPGHQARTILDLFWFCSVQFVYQQYTAADRRDDVRRELETPASA